MPAGFKVYDLRSIIENDSDFSYPLVPALAGTQT